MSDHEVRAPKEIIFLVYDGRANIDPDEAIVMEAISEYVNFERVWHQFKRDWGDTDCVLFAYETQGSTLVNGRPIYELADLEYL